MKKFALILSFVGLAFAFPSAYAEELFLDGDFEAAQAAAKSANKLVMIDFKAEWCGPCKMLDRTTWKDEDVVSAVKEKAVAIKVDVDKHRDLAAHFGIRSIPTVIFIDADGKEVSRFIGYRDADGFLEEFGKIGNS